MAEHSQRISSPLLRVSLFLVVLLIASFALALGSGLVYQWLLGINIYAVLTKATYLPHFLLLYTLQTILFIALIYLFCRTIDRRPLTSLGLESGSVSRHLVQGALLGALLVGIGFVPLWLGDLVSVHLGQGRWQELALYLLLFALVALGEELVFRGYLFVNLQQRFTNGHVVLISSVLFVLFHLGNEHLFSIGVLNVFLAGLVLGALRLHRNGLWLAMGVHFGWNFVQGPLLGFAVSGIEIHGQLTTQSSGSDWLSGGAFGLEGSLLATVTLFAALFILYPRKYHKGG